jgi:hypothetical protein
MLLMRCRPHPDSHSRRGGGGFGRAATPPAGTLIFPTLNNRCQILQVACG